MSVYCSELWLFNRFFLCVDKLFIACREKNKENMENMEK